MGLPVIKGTTLSSRQRQAFNLMVRGKSVKAVARIMGLSEGTIRKYIDEYKEVIAQTANQITREDYAGLVIARFESLRAEVWAEHGRAKKSNERSRLLRLIMDLDKRELDALMELGLIQRTPEQHQHNHTILGQVNFTQEEKAGLDALAVTMMAESMGVSVADAKKMCGRPAHLMISPGNGKANGGHTHPEIIEITPVLEQG